MTERVEIFEVGPRDGLQNEARLIPVEEKIALVDCLSLAGFRRIECASFVSPKWVPQMADSAAVLAGIARTPEVSYTALTPNLRGFEDALAAGADEVAIFGSASEGFSKANINATIAESLERFRPVAEAAVAAGVPLRGYVSCVVECPYDGVVAPDAVARVVAALRDMGCYEVSLGDTIGRATPESIVAMLDAVLQEMPAERLAGHYHDTGGLACDNVEASLGLGLRVFDAAVGGLGGCPYAPGAAGNVATEAVAERVASLGYEHGLNMDVVAEAAAMARRMRG
ncbi:MULTISPECIES: hydroxymethylglutaryl-CoA lyase [Marivita]|uniref:Hydroxymethylglutaryl-CoA lyase n=1 Tax=Marivita cryptomonadis TaxID=505252 RepID=A0A9Q2S5P6_9RHOB|nr:MULTISPECIES: hydroxymethylglutaryl-CoA lyase [Marivita]MCR9169402.1 hydroxymethylglutaryl-CoA lyase [Paracoccaceae bacterium]MBM2322384.1 hydroxymethylglutaryl-CoA lyase [Marivita cryptomonadis]MBM2331966.1 hydroxymethylglutaryl-CoA lyase [Marivita cryptomonadis]MBM2341550.1 hydroxymethylglutaryl-CoA lyase [Marivita cryptomonadis]MBM2346214.1 hydroxymethylglutaryl-CoA lyase [Marivita cryptomonadis]